MMQLLAQNLKDYSEKALRTGKFDNYKTQVLHAALGMSTELSEIRALLPHNRTSFIWHGIPLSLPKPTPGCFLGVYLDDSYSVILVKSGVDVRVEDLTYIRLGSIPKECCPNGTAGSLILAPHNVWLCKFFENRGTPLEEALEGYSKALPGGLPFKVLAGVPLPGLKDHFEGSLAASFIEEMGDAWWFSCFMASTLGIDLSSLATIAVSYSLEVDEILHGMDLAVSTLLDLIKKDVAYGKEVDAKEIGQCALAYMRYLDLLPYKLNSVVPSYPNEGAMTSEILNANLAKLSVRYPGLIFDSERALHRDASAEMTALGVS
jgi:hypothetical protein